jgi:hypothetical protein
MIVCKKIYKYLEKFNYTHLTISVSEAGVTEAGVTEAGVNESG